MLTPSASSRRSSCDSVSSSPAAMRSATASVGLVSPRSTWESIGAETPERSASSRSESCMPSRRARTRGPNACCSAAATVAAISGRTLSRTLVCQTLARLPRGPHQDLVQRDVLGPRDGVEDRVRDVLGLEDLAYPLAHGLDPLSHRRIVVALELGLDEAGLDAGDAYPGVQRLL